MAEGNIHCEIENGIARIVIDRPKALNALDRSTLSELDALLARLAADDNVRVLVLRGEGEKARSLCQAHWGRIRGELL